MELLELLGAQRVLKLLDGHRRASRSRCADALEQPHALLRCTRRLATAGCLQTACALACRAHSRLWPLLACLMLAARPGVSTAFAAVKRACAANGRLCVGRGGNNG
eukprot:6270727-Prymnesium_polylepis.1